MKKLFSSNSYRVRVIAAFFILSVSLVTVTALTGYRFIRGLYLEETAGHISSLTGIYADGVNSDFLFLLSMGKPSAAADEFFQNRFAAPSLAGGRDIFIINRQFQVLLHNRKSNIYGISEPDLLLHKSEIDSLQIGNNFVSTPFRGSDGKWYLWGFKRMNNDFYLGIRENAARFQKVEELSGLFWLIGLAGTILSVVFSLVLAGSVSRPIKKLIQFSTEIGTGRLHTTVRPNVKGELGILAEAMDKMRTDLAGQQQSREHMLAHIAHEIRNPLGGIELLSHLVKEDLTGYNKSTEYIDQIIKEIAGLKELITSFLNFSKPRPAAPAWVNLQSCIAGIIDLLRLETDKRNINISLNLGQNQIFFDEEHLRQILINLISNSINSIGEGGEINILSATAGDCWEISVSDSGQGIPDDKLTNIFEPFFSGRSDGTGLGLSICRKLAEENNAMLTVLNLPGSGCIFTITKEMTNEN